LFLSIDPIGPVDDALPPIGLLFEIAPDLSQQRHQLMHRSGEEPQAREGKGCVLHALALEEVREHQ
jgi:hypothetical protein